MFNSLAPWLSVPPTYLPTTVKAQPPGSSPLQPTDLLLGWQDGQHPSTRAIELQQLFSSPSVSYPFLPLTGGTISGNLTVSGVMMLSRDPSQPLEAVTKQYVDGGGGAGSGGGPFLPTAGGVLNSPGNLVVGGTLGVIGEMTVASNGIKYTGVGSLNDIAFNWNNVSISGYVDGVSIGDIATVASVAAGYLPLLGGTISGNLGVSGNTTLHNTTFAGNLGIAFTGVYNSGVSYAFGWDGTAINYAINGAGKGQLYTVGQNDGRYKSIGSYTPNQVVDYNANPSFFHLYVRGNLGINYANFTANWIAFSWDAGNALTQYFIDGTYRGTHASTVWVNANFKSISAYTPNQNVDNGSGPRFGNIMNVQGTMYVADNTLYYFQRNGTTGDWRIVDNNNVVFNVSPSADMSSIRNITANGWIRVTGGDNGVMCNVANSWLALNGNSSFGSGGTIILSGNASVRSGRLIEFYDGASQRGWFINTGDPAFTILTRAFKPGGGVWEDASDARVKDVTGDYNRGLDDILKLNPVRYRFRGNASFAGIGTEKSDVDTKREYSGFLAQEVEEVMPEMVTRHKGVLNESEVDDLLSTDLTALPLALVNAVKELHARVAMLEKRK